MNQETEIQNLPAVEPAAPTPVVVTDPDELALQEAHAQLAAQTAPAVAAPPAEPAAPVAPAAPKADPQAAAFISMRKKIRDLEMNNALLAGQAQAYATMAQPAQPQAEPEPQADPLAALHAERVQLAERFDAGELTAREWEAQRQALEGREWDLRAQAMQPVAAPAPVTADLQLEQATDRLIQDYPVLAVTTPEMLEPLANIARHQAALEGRQLVGAVGTLELRTRMAKLAQQMYGGGLPVQATPAAPGLSTQAQALDAKLAMAASMPPDVSKMGSTASAAPPSESELVARMSGMTEDEQLALLGTMPGLRSKIMGLS